MPDSPSACARCPRAQVRTCCEVEGDERLATLTEGDIARIQEATGLARQRFVDQQVFSPEEAFAYERLRPVNAGALRGSVRQHLKVVGSACVFHRPESGCTLRAAARPLLCRLYPFEIDDLGQLRAEPDGPCHGVDAAEGPEAMLAHLQTDEATLRRLHAQVLAEQRESLSSR